MSKVDEQSVSEFIAEQLQINLKGTKYRLDGWGEVDNWAQLDNGVFVFLEVETTQKHPNTNVLKLWPYLEDNKAIRIFLIQTYFPTSSGLTSNRGRLGEWTANKLKTILGKRFDYQKLVIDGNNDKTELKELKTKISDFGKRK
ncbi:MAG: hypothetical protein ABIQ40_08440 [Bacteroidia bacterium]